MEKIHNKKPNADKELTTHGVLHKLPDQVINRFFGKIETPVRISECRIFHDFSVDAFTYLSGGYLYHTYI